MPQFRPRQTKRAQRLRNSATDAERKLWGYLSRRQLNGLKFSRQMPIAPYICDFLCREQMLIVEVDGGQHSENAKDLTRTAFLEQQGYRVIRFWNNDVMENVEGVLQVIELALDDCPPPSPSRLREGVSAQLSPLPLAGGEEPRSGEGVGPARQAHSHPQPPPASGRGLR